GEFSLDPPGTPRRECSDDFVSARRNAQSAHRGDRLREPAGDYVLKIPQIGINVQRKAVRRDPAADVNPNGCDLHAVYPDARAPVQPAGLNAEAIKRADNHVFQGPDIRNNIPLPVAQIEDRVSYHLPRPMISD